MLPTDRAERSLKEVGVLCRSPSCSLVNRGQSTPLSDRPAKLLPSGPRRAAEIVACDEITCSPRVGSPEAGPLRDRVYYAVRAEPWINLTRLARSLERAPSSVAYHVDALIRSGQLTQVRAGVRSCLHVAGDDNPTLSQASAVLTNPTAKRIADTIAANSECDIARLAHYSGLPRHVIYYYLPRLMRAGLVGSRSLTRYFQLYPRPLMRAVAHPRDLSQRTQSAYAVGEVPGQDASVGKSTRDHQQRSMPGP